MSKASKYGKKVPSYSQPDAWHLGEKGFVFFPKGGNSSKGSLFPGVYLCMSRGKVLIPRYSTLHPMPHSTRTVYVGSPYLGSEGLLWVEKCCHLLVLGAEH